MYFLANEKCLFTFVYLNCLFFNLKEIVYFDTQLPTLQENTMNFCFRDLELTVIQDCKQDNKL